MKLMKFLPLLLLVLATPVFATTIVIGEATENPTKKWTTLQEYIRKGSAERSEIIVTLISKIAVAAESCKLATGAPPNNVGQLSRYFSEDDDFFFSFGHLIDLNEDGTQRSYCAATRQNPRNSLGYRRAGGLYIIHYYGEERNIAATFTTFHLGVVFTNSLR